MATLSEIEDQVTLLSSLHGITWPTPPTAEDLLIWVCGCPHMRADLPARLSLTDAHQELINAGETPHMILLLGDLSNDEDPPTASQAGIIADQQAQIDPLADILYPIAGNHDGGNGEMLHYQAVVDSAITSPNKPYAIDGNWERYAISIGNLLILMLSDNNSLPYPWGRGSSPETGGHPSGTITLDTWNWLLTKVSSHYQHSNIIICAHSTPPNTNIGTGFGEGNNWHGSSGIPEGRGALWSIYDESTQSAFDNTDYFKLLAQQYPHVAFLGSHTHYALNETYAGRSFFEIVDFVRYIKVGHLSTNHAGNNHGGSVLLRFTNGSTSAALNKFVHFDPNQPTGLYAPNNRTLPLPYAYDPNFTLPPDGPLPSWPPATPTIFVIDDGDAGFSHSNFEHLANPALPGYNVGWHRKKAGTGTGLATWTFSSLAAGTYRISAYWKEKENRANDASYTINDGGSPIVTAQVDQRNVPIAHVVHNSFPFQNIGTVPINSGTLTVTLPQSANQSGQVMADAIRIEKL